LNHLKIFSSRSLFIFLSILVFASAAFIIFYPMGTLFLKGLFGEGNTAGGTDLLPAGIWQSLLNTLLLASAVVIITTLLGGTLAWFVVRTDLPGKKIINAFSILAFLIPSYILGLAYLLMFGRNGYAERIFHLLSGGGGYGFEYYSIGGAALVLSIHLFPLTYMAIKNSLSQIDPDLERAASISGASRLMGAFTVVLPLVRPSIMAAALLVFCRSMANFEVPALICLPGRKEVLTTHIFSSLSDLNIQGAAFLSFILVFISVILFAMQSRFFMRGFDSSRTTAPNDRVTWFLGRKKWFISGSAIVILAMVSILPIAVMFVSSFLKRWGLPLEAEYFTLHNYSHLIFESDMAHSAFFNSITYGITASAGAALIGCFLAWFSSKGRSRVYRFIETAATVPIAFPNIVLAVAAILAWNCGIFKLYGTKWAIIVTYLVVFIPLMAKQITGISQGHDSSMIRAARICGASPLRSFFTVTLPAIMPGLKSGFFICTVIALREIPISLLLYSKGQETLGVMLFGMQSQSYGLEMTSALSILIIFIIVSGNMIFKKFSRRRVYQ